LDPYPPPAPVRLESAQQSASTALFMEQVALEAVPEGSRVPEAQKVNSNGGKERSQQPKTAKAVSNGVVGTGVAGPSNASSTPFAYSEARAQQIWEHACAEDYLGAHALFDPREQVTFIDGEAKVRHYLNGHPETKARLRAPTDGNPRQSIYICGASAIWRRTGDETNGGTPPYKVTYEPCHDSAYATMDNYKKHIYRHHLNKVYKSYPKKSSKGKAKA
jgi:hypothetical protein